MFHRLSVHVRRQAVGQSQTAVIRPLTSASQDQQTGYNFTPDTDRTDRESQSNKGLYNVSEEGDDGNLHGATQDRREPASYTPAHLSDYNAGHLDIGQVETLSSNVSIFDEMMGNTMSPGYNPLDNQLPLPLQGELMSEHGSEMEALDLIHGFMYESTVQEEDEEEMGGEDVLAQSKLNLLTPPSPFRDSHHVGPIHGSPAFDNRPNASRDVTYAPKQSSFTL